MSTKKIDPKQPTPTAAKAEESRDEERLAQRKAQRMAQRKAQRHSVK